LAYALPFRRSGARVHVLLARVAAFSSPGRKGVNLGYVLAHEIGHVLEKLTRHSAEGVMKECWNQHDFARMAGHRLGFAAEDAELIHFVF
jgi:predicted Zn-dependent protease